PSIHRLELRFCPRLVPPFHLSSHDSHLLSRDRRGCVSPRAAYIGQNGRDRLVIQRSQRRHRRFSARLAVEHDAYQCICPSGHPTRAHQTWRDTVLAFPIHLVASGADSVFLSTSLVTLAL